MLGLATGDAVGTTVEFQPRGSFEPLTDMVGGGPFALQPGQWTDDTSMALCLASSLIECGGFDPRDQMERYLAWMERGEWSSTGACFDVGLTVRSALREYGRGGDPFSGPTDPERAGNGSIMRLAPIPVYYCPDLDRAERFAADSSRTTHGAQECVDACRLLARITCRALLGHPRDEVLMGDGASFAGAESIVAIARGAYRDKPATRIRGSGYVVDCLEAALWAFARTDGFREAVLVAANLGDDADTTAAVCGQVAGAYYGAAAIPATWVERLWLREEILALVDRLRRSA